MIDKKNLIADISEYIALFYEPELGAELNACAASVMSTAESSIADFECDYNVKHKKDAPLAKKDYRGGFRDKSFTLRRTEVSEDMDSWMSRMEETFSQRLFRMMREKGLDETETYKKAYVDRRHFSKIKNDINYSPTKKTVAT